MPIWNCSRAKRCASILATSRDYHFEQGRLICRATAPGCQSCERQATSPALSVPGGNRQLSPHYSAATGRGDSRPVSEFRHNLIQGRIDNCDLCAQSDHLVKFNYVIRTHSHATVADRQSQVPFFRRSVNIDITAEGIRVLRLSPTQPKNAANDRIAPGSIG